MKWEDTIIEIRKDPLFSDLVRNAYFDEDLVANVERFRKSPEFLETLRLLRVYKRDARKLLDIGSGNGIAAVCFTLEGYEVLAIEPDPSITIGAGAIRILKEHYQLHKLEVKELFAEELFKENAAFDIVYVRQALHHAHNLNLFVKSASGLLKPEGIFVAVREHVIYNEKDKQWFLASHPLQKFYGGENAFTLSEYNCAFNAAGLKLLKSLSHFENVINYAPLNEKEISKIKKNEIDQYKKYIINKYPLIGKTVVGWIIYKWIKKISEENFPEEKKVAGRLFSFICKKG
jgi:2-polyprenyl-3-methyl-5-hydroxy-6-metoxy-1,4-benzoquinol methylase